MVKLKCRKTSEGQTDQLRQTIYQINHGEVNILTGHKQCHLHYFLLRQKLAFQPKLEGELYIFACFKI